MSVEKKYRFIYKLLTNNYSQSAKTNGERIILIAYCNTIIFYSHPLYLLKICMIYIPG
jgi:hypothetical protein